MLISCSPPMGVTAGLPYSLGDPVWLYWIVCAQILWDTCQRDRPPVHAQDYTCHTDQRDPHRGYHTCWSWSGCRIYDIISISCRICNLHLQCFIINMFCWHRSLPLSVWVLGHMLSRWTQQAQMEYGVGLIIPLPHTHTYIICIYMYRKVHTYIYIYMKIYVW